MTALTKFTKDIRLKNAPFILLFIIGSALTACFLTATVQCVVGQIREDARARLHSAMSSGAEPTIIPVVDEGKPIDKARKRLNN